jgi:hypothetical protein
MPTPPSATIHTGLLGVGGLALCPDGSFYVSLREEHVIKRVALDGSMSCVAGRMSVEGSTDGPAAEALLSSPRHLSLCSDGSLFIAEVGRVRCLSPQGTVRTVLLLRQSPFFRNFSGLAARPDGGLLLTFLGGSIMCVSQAGQVTFAGTNDGSESYAAAAAAEGEEEEEEGEEKEEEEEAVELQGEAAAAAGGAEGRVGWHGPLGFRRAIQADGRDSPASLSGVLVSPQGEVYFCDHDFHGSVFIMSADGSIVRELKHRFRDPYALALGKDGSLYVLEADMDCGRVKRVT